MRRKIMATLWMALLFLTVIGIGTAFAGPVGAPAPLATEEPVSVAVGAPLAIPEEIPDTGVVEAPEPIPEEEPQEQPADAPALEPSNIITESPTVRLGIPRAVRFKQQGPDLYALIDTSVIFHKAGLEIMREQPVTIWIDVDNISSNALTVQALKADLLAKADTHLKYLPLELANVLVEPEKTQLIFDDQGVLESVRIQINVEVQALAIGTLTNALEVAFTGSTQPDGTVLWNERVRVIVEGMIFTSLDPQIASLRDVLEDIRNNAVVAFSNL